MDSFTTSETVGWGSRLIDSIKGVLFGLLMFAISFPLLFWNEGRAVRRAQDLSEGAAAVQEADSNAVNPAHEGKLVHVTGPVVSGELVRDDVYGLPFAGAIRGRRVVEMYQWTERAETRTQSNTGGSQTRRTTYTYRMEWSASPSDSSRFQQPNGHYNPPMQMRGAEFTAQSATIGARALTPALIRQVDGYQPMAVQLAQVPGLTTAGLPVHPHEGGFYLGTAPASPSVGDYRVHWEAAPQGPMSVLAAQHGNTFQDWQTPSGRTLEQNLERGVVSAQGMFSSLEAGNTVLTWVLRFVGWLLMFLGIMAIARPLVVVADVLPIAGSIVGAGSGLVAFLVASPLSLLTVAVGWIVYRPLLGIGLAVVAVAIAVVAGKQIAARGAAANAQRAAQRQGQGAAMGFGRV